MPRQPARRSCQGACRQRMGACFSYMIFRFPKSDVFTCRLGLPRHTNGRGVCAPTALARHGGAVRPMRPKRLMSATLDSCSLHVVQGAGMEKWCALSVFRSLSHFSPSLCCPLHASESRPRAIAPAHSANTGTARNAPTRAAPGAIAPWSRSHFYSSKTCVFASLSTAPLLRLHVHRARRLGAAERAAARTNSYLDSLCVRRIGQWQSDALLTATSHAVAAALASSRSLWQPAVPVVSNSVLHIRCQLGQDTEVTASSLPTGENRVVCLLCVAPGRRAVR